MKKLITMSLMSFIIAMTVLTAFAQSSNRVVMTSTSTHAATDTALNTTPKIQRTFNSGNALNVATTFQIKLTPISGTTGGVVRLKASADGVNFVRINPTDSLVVSSPNALNKTFTIGAADGRIYSDYQLEYTGAATTSTKMNSVMIYRRE